MVKETREIVREKYGEAARSVASADGASCCGTAPGGNGAEGESCCGPGTANEACDPISRDLYEMGETEGLPEGAVQASLGCGNPAALAELHKGEVVLDLGSGGGIDVLLSARRVGGEGKVYGLDMTADMLELARRNQREAGVENVEFLKGEIEAIPLPDDSVDVIISNCVINLSADKRQVLREAYRVLRPGGRFAVSDVVVRGEVPAAVRRSMELWIGCVAGALEEREFEGLLGEVGFEDAAIEPTRVYAMGEAKAFLAAAGLDAERIASEVDGRFVAAFVRGRKPVR